MAHIYYAIEKKAHTLTITSYTLHPCVSEFPSNFPKVFFSVHCMIYLNDAVKHCSMNTAFISLRDIT